jgi:Transposase DDE domain group 1
VGKIAGPKLGRFRGPLTIVTNMSRPAERVVAFYNKRGTCEQWIKEGKGAIHWTRLSCRTFAANAVRLQLHALAYNLGNFLRTLATPEPIKDWSLTSLKRSSSRSARRSSATAATWPSRWLRSPSHGKCSRRFCGSLPNYGHSRRLHRHEVFVGYAFKSNRREECVQMPAKNGQISPLGRRSGCQDYGRRPHRQGVLSERGQSAKIHPGLGVHLENPGSNQPVCIAFVLERAMKRTVIGVSLTIPAAAIMVMIPVTVGGPAGFGLMKAAAYQLFPCARTPKPGVMCNWVCTDKGMCTNKNRQIGWRKVPRPDISYTPGQMEYENVPVFASEWGCRRWTCVKRFK